MITLGWDIGGVNTKVALVAGGRVMDARVRPFELQRAPDTLGEVLRSLAADVIDATAHAGAPIRHAVTMTAELSQLFRTKREGVAFVLDAVEGAFPGAPIAVFTVNGHFVPPLTARAEPLQVAAANWSATAHVVARAHADAVLVDVGSTTTDIIPIVAGEVVARGSTDPERLLTGELVYTGAVRTPAEAIASRVPLGDGDAAVSAEGFALAGDVHLWRGDLAPADYAAPTPDGRPATREFTAERLARVVCADREMLGEADVSRIADALAAAQERRIVDAIGRVHGRHPRLRVAVVTGAGAFLAARAARAAGLDVVELARDIGAPAARHAPAAAVALLLDTRVPARNDHLSPERVRLASPVRADTVVKVGGSLLADATALDAALRAIAEAARDRRVLVVPGGGPLADAVRDLDTRLGLTDDAAHWMAVLAMDQCAYLLASRIPGAEIVSSAAGVTALAGGRVAVLAPARWLREADPLPHSWDVTSDSIAAWVADAVGAGQLVLIKPSGANGELVDRWFARSARSAREAIVVTADSFDAVLTALRRSTRDAEPVRFTGADRAGTMP